MQSVEMYFNDMIAKHDLFKQAAFLLMKEVPSLTPTDIHDRCENLLILKRELTKDNDQLSIRMEFLGPGILDTTYLGDFQRALDQSILACDLLHAEILLYKDSLLSHLK
ncbi:MAG: hypothetical protein KJ630_24830 [Proteobacteria bacterium]|nr:hypothetical protein [Pseudomonadota bacterium]